MVEVGWVIGVVVYVGDLLVVVFDDDIVVDVVVRVGGFGFVLGYVMIWLWSFLFGEGMRGECFMLW